MNPLDWLLAAIVLYSTVKAFLIGFVREALALAGLIIGLFAACWTYQSLAGNLAGLVSSPPIAQLVAFVAVLAAIIVLFTLIGRLLQKTASAVGLGILDRLGGAAFGFLRGCGLCVALLLAVTAFLPTATWMQTSRFVPYFLQSAHAVSFVVPADMKHKLLDGISHIKHTPPDWIKLRSS